MRKLLKNRRNAGSVEVVDCFLEDQHVRVKFPGSFPIDVYNTHLNASSSTD